MPVSVTRQSSETFVLSRKSSSAMQPSDEFKKAQRQRRDTERTRTSSGYHSLSDGSSAPSSPSPTSQQRKKSRRSVGSPPPSYEEFRPDLATVPSEDELSFSNLDDLDQDEDASRKWSTGSKLQLSTVIDMPAGECETDVFSESEFVDPFAVRTNKNRRRKPSNRRIKPVDGEEAKQHLIDYVKTKPLLRNDIAEKCTILNSSRATCYRVRVVTMGETRSIVERTKPYHGQTVKSSPQQSIWDYDISSPENFCNDTKYFSMPKSEEIATCKTCHGSCKTKCSGCDGERYKICSRCHGTGKMEMSHQRCPQCNGGHEHCPKCTDGNVNCVTCHAKGRVIKYKVLKVTWSVHHSVRMEAIDDVPYKLLERAHGKEIFVEEGDQLDPIRRSDFPSENVCRWSKSCLEKHRYLDDKVLQQRQTVTAVPVQAVYCLYKNKEFCFYLIGKSKRVYTPYYPKQRLRFMSKLLS